MIRVVVVSVITNFGVVYLNALSWVRVSEPGHIGRLELSRKVRPSASGKCRLLATAPLRKLGSMQSGVVDVVVVALVLVVVVAKELAIVKVEGVIMEVVALDIVVLELIDIEVPNGV